MFRLLRIEHPNAWYHVDEEELLKSKRRTFNEQRNFLEIYLCRRFRGNKLGEICKEFHIKRYSSASSAIEGAEAQISKDGRLRRRVE